MKVTITIEDSSEQKHELVFDEGNFTTNEWINMTLDGKTYDVNLNKILSVLIAFDAQKSRLKNDE